MIQRNQASSLRLSIEQDETNFSRIILFENLLDGLAGLKSLAISSLFLSKIQCEA